MESWPDRDPDAVASNGALGMSDRNILRIENGALTIIPRGLDRLWCVRSHVVVPLASITAVGIEPDPHRIPLGWRGPGLDFMGKLCGTFHPNGERHFWNYSGSGEALRVELGDGQHFRQMYLSVESAENSRRLLSDAIASHV
jgi:hypothetical protein